MFSPTQPANADRSSERRADTSTRATPYETVALVLQGGGALGSYQAGVYEGLHQANLLPDWIAGISIGALNTAVIAGNPPERRVQRLREFWETICRPAMSWPHADAMKAWMETISPKAREVFNGLTAWRAIMEGQQDFFSPRGLAPWLGLKQDVTQVSFYDTAWLKSTLARFVDFDLINHGPVRVSVGAVNVQTGNFEYFDNTKGATRGRLRAEHFMASAALPPGFPAIEIDGEFYWDGGIVSNTPLSYVLETAPRRDTLTFQVDLWSARGKVPDNIYEVQERQKDIQYSSKTRALTHTMAKEQHYRRLLRELLQAIPPEQHATNEWVREARELACAHRYNVIHLIYQDKEWEGLYKDYEFSPRTMNEHWSTGLQDIEDTLQHKSWLELPPEGREFITHDHLRSRP